MIAHMKSAGLNRVMLGVEALNDEDLTLFNKGITTGQVRQAMAVLQDHGFSALVEADLRIKVGLIAWHPGTSIEGLYEITRFMRQYSVSPKRLNRRLRLLTGAPIWDTMRSEGLVTDDRKRGWHYRQQGLAAVEQPVLEMLSLLEPVRDRLRTVEKWGRANRTDVPVAIEP